MGEHGRDLDPLDPSTKSIKDDRFDLRESMETTMTALGEGASPVDPISEDKPPDPPSSSKTLSGTAGEINVDKNTGDCVDPWKGKELCWNCISERYEFQTEPLLGTGTYSDVFLVHINSVGTLV
jgi:hypothetical protein